MGVGQIISDTFAIVKARFGPLLGLWAIYLAITLVLFAVLGVGMGMAGVAGLASMSEGILLAAGIGSFCSACCFTSAILSWRWRNMRR